MKGMRFLQVGVIVGLFSTPFYASDKQKKLDEKLVKACQEGDYDKVKSLLTPGIFDKNIADVNGGAEPSKFNNPLLQTILHAPKDRVKIIDFLIRKKANINLYFSNKDTILMMACRLVDDVAVIKSLLNGSHVLINAIDDSGNTALNHALSKSRINLEIIKELVQHGANVKITNKWGNSSLMILAQNSSITSKDKDVFTFLIKNGADKNAKNNSGLNALTVALDYNNKAAQDILKDLGVDEQKALWKSLGLSLSSGNLRG